MEREGIMIVETVWDSAPEIVAFKGHDDWGTYIPERTCRVELVDQNESDPVGVAICSECGSNGFEMQNSNYCSYCGAKVVV